MEIIDDLSLLKAVEAFLATTGMAPTRFGRDVMGEASLVARLRDGRSLSLKNANKVIAFIKANEPVHGSVTGDPAPRPLAPTDQSVTERVA